MNTVSAYQTPEPLDMWEAGRVLWRGRLWILASVVLFAAGFVGVMYFASPAYEANVVLVAVNADRSAGALGSALDQLGGLGALVGVNVGGGESKTQEAIAVLKSRQFTAEFIEQNHLMPKLFARRWDAQRGAWRDDRGRVPTMAMACKYFDRKIRSVDQDKKTGLITLAVRWRDRLEAASWANELASRLNAEMRSRAITQANDSMSYLEKELNTTTLIESRLALNHLLEAQIRNRMMSVVTQQYAFRVVDPAMPPDANDPVFPNWPLMLAAGPVTGLLVGIFLVLAIHRMGANRTPVRA